MQYLGLMPAQVTHILAAEEALKLAAPDLAEAWGIAAGWDSGHGGGKNAWFRLGAQGPDIFYHNQRTKPSGLHYGALAHRRNYGLAVEAMTAALVESGSGPDSASGAWLLGFATHAAVDRVIHPFVVYFSGWQIPLVPESARFRSCHPFLERLLDIDALSRLRGLPIGACDLAMLLPFGGGPGAGSPDISGDAGTEAELVRLLAKGLRAAFPSAVGSDFLIERRIGNAMLDARYFLQVTNPALTSSGSQSLLPWFDDRSGWRSMALIYPERLPPGIDVANEAHATWDHPAGDGRKSESSHAELLGLAIEKAAKAISLVAAAMRSRRVEAGFATEIGNGGLSVTDGDGIPVPPRLSRPLPLKAIMEAEFERRTRLERDRASAASGHQ